MRFLADTCVPRQVLERLRSDGRDVTRADAGIDDEVILAAALAQGRVLITEDRDFGGLAILKQLPHAGILLLRMPELTPNARAERVASVVAEMGDRLSIGLFVVEADRLR